MKKPVGCECTKAQKVANCSALKELVRQIKLLPGDKIYPCEGTTTTYQIVRKNGSKEFLEIAPGMVVLIVSLTIYCLINNEESCQRCRMEGGPLCLWQYAGLPRVKSCLK